MMIETKICENCKHRNLVTAVECEECGYDLTFVFPQSIDDSIDDARAVDGVNEDEKDNSEWILVLISDEKEELSISDEISLGRDCDPFNAQFNSSNFTSRIHAKVRACQDGIQVMDASTNGTFIDNKRIGKMEWVNAGENSIIKFADIEFTVRRKGNAN